MSNFTINTSYPPISYSSKASDISLKACNDVTSFDAITFFSASNVPECDYNISVRAINAERSNNETLV